MNRHLDKVEEVSQELRDQREGQGNYDALRMIWSELRHEFASADRDRPQQ